MISLEKSRTFVHANGTLWERALWDYLFDQSPIDRLYQTLLCYKNPDGGWGHGLEHDIKCPQSNPLQLEFLLAILRDTGIPPGNLLKGTPQWVESIQQADGTLSNPTNLLDYHHAPWWNAGGQTMPDSITGNLTRYGSCTPSIANTTKSWVIKNLTLEKIHSNDWLFMAYHAHDYFLNVTDFPDLKIYRQAVVNNIIQCATTHVENQEFSKARALFRFATAPNTEIANAVPPSLLEQILDYLEASQRDDGGWDDEHDLSYWQPYHSTTTLLTLRSFNRI